MSPFFVMVSRVLFAALVCAGSVAGQDVRGRISGRVSDPSGALTPKVEVTVSNVETGVRFSALTNEAGNFEISYLQPGRYTLRAALTGFRTYERQDLEVRVGDRLTIDIALEVGQLSDSITVSGQASLLESSTASVGRVVDARRILDLPLPGGNALSLSRLAPGVVNLGAPNHPSLGPATEVLSNLTINGVRGGNIEFTVDGTPSMWGTNAAYAPPTEMVAEFKVQTATYDASLGRAAGGNVNVVLRSGANQFRTSLYLFHNNQRLQSLDLFQRQLLYNPATGPVTEEKKKQANPLNILNRYGAAFSGPVFVPWLYNGRNRTFWVFGFEGLTRPGVERGNAFSTVPTLAQRRGDFSELLRIGANYQIYDPATTVAAGGGRYSRQPFAGNLIPAGRLDKTALNLLPYWPDPNTQGTNDGRNTYVRLPRSWNEFRTYTAKVDHNFSDKHRVFGRYSQWFQLFSAGQVFETVSTGTDRWRRNYGGVIDDVYVISPTLLNDFRAGLTRTEQSTYPLAKDFDMAAAGFSRALVDGIDPQARTFPNIDIAGYTAIGTASVSRSFNNYFTMTDDLSWTRGNHTFKFGAELRVYREHNSNFGNVTPSQSFTNRWTGGPLDNSPAAPIGQGLASFLLGIPSDGQINVNDTAAEQSRTTSFYIQDDWRVSRTLTLNLGLRYDYDSPMTERFNRSVRGFDFTTQNPIAQRAMANYARAPIAEIPASQFRVIGGLTFAGNGGLPRALWTGDRNNFAPRIGFAWNPRKSTVLRGGYGIFYVPLGADRVAVNQSGYTARTMLVPSTDNGLTFIASLSNPFPNGWSPRPGASEGLATDAGRGVSFFNENGVNGYMQRYSLGIQRQLPGSFVLDVSHVGNRGAKLAASRQYTPIPNQYLSKLPARDQAAINHLSTQVPNPFYPLPGTNLAGTNVARSQLLRPYPHFTSLTANEPVGYSWYHSLQTSIERRFRNGVTFQFNHTWSKMMEATGFLNGGDPMPEEVISDLDRTHRVALSGIWELPFGGGKRWLSGAPGVVRQMAGGWQLQAVWQSNSGPPIGFGNALLIQDIRAVALPGGERTLDRWFNTAAFNRNSGEQLGSNLQTLSTRFSGIHAAGVDVWDISAVKNFAIAEKWKVQFRTEFLNALNRSNLAGPNTAPVNSLFGKVNATVGFPRYIHFGLKLTF
jgi:hypothetical protein